MKMTKLAFLGQNSGGHGGGNFSGSGGGSPQSPPPPPPLLGETLRSDAIRPGVVACTYIPATLEAKFRNGVGLIPVGGNSPSIGGWIVRPPVIQHQERSLTKYWDLTET